MRSLGLVLVLLASQLSLASATEAVAHVHEHQDSFEQAGHLPASELLRSVVSFDLLEYQEGRSRDTSTRGPTGKPTLRAAFGIAVVSSGCDLLPPSVPPSPAQAERLPYHATAPPR